jgi:DNA-binding transcriptional ArsR family regulator
MVSCSATRMLRAPRVASYSWKATSPSEASATIVTAASLGKASPARNASRPSVGMQEAIDAIAHPGRRALLRLVLDRELPVSELAERIGVSQPAASQHLKVLRDAGLVRGRVDGRRRLYRVDLNGLERLRRELDAYWGPALRALKQATEAGHRP